MALVVGDLVAYLKVDKSDWSRGLAEAKSELDGLARSADQQANASSSRTARMVTSVSDSMAKVGVTADKQGQQAGGAFGDAFSKRVDSALKSLPSGEVKLDDAVAQVRIASLRDALESLSDKRIGVDLSAGEALAEVERIKTELASIGDETVDVQVRADTSSARSELDRLFKSAGDGAGPAGEDAGGKLSQGMNMAITRNSPLIVAAIGGALAAGAPVAIAGATALFAGIGIVAAAQSEVVQKAWSNTWDNIKAGAQADASVLVPVLTNAASVIGESFQRMRPLLQDAFAASAPLIDTFVGSVTRAAENALPGMVRAVEASGPVMTGLGHLMETVGTGISQFFDILSEHAPAAGRAFAAIGDIAGALLPILGQFLGAGAELAASVLPPLASALGAVAHALDAIAPVLPAVASGFLAMKAATTGLNVLDTVAQGVGRLGTQVGVSTAGLATFGSGLAAVAPFAAVAAAGIGVAIHAWGEHDRQIQANVDVFTNLQQAMLTGGTAAATAGEAADKATWFWKALGVATEDIPGFKKAADDAHALFDAMTPLQQAQAEVTHWTNELAAAQGNSSFVLHDMNGNVVTLTQAQAGLSDSSQRAAEIQRELDQATSGMSRTLQQAADAADQLSSALDALNGGQLSLNDANRAYQQSLADINERLDGARQGLDGYSMSLDNTTESGRQNTAALDDFARAAEDSANAVYKQTGSYDQFSGALINGRNALYDSAVAFGMSDEAARAYVDSVLAIPPVTSMDIETNTQTVSQEVQNLSSQLSTLPPGQALVTWASDEAVQKLASLGYDIVGLPDGEVSISANDGPFQGVFAGVLGSIQTIAGQHPTPPIDANPGPFNGVAAAVQAAISNIAGQHPTPPIDANPGPFNGIAASVMASINNIASQHPTPVANMIDGPFRGVFAGVMGSINTVASQRPNPIATMTDFASGVANSITAAINRIPAYRTVTVAVQQVGAALGGLFPATGGAVDDYSRMWTPIWNSASKRAGGGPVSGPGGPTDDLVPAMLGGHPFRLSNGEHVLTARDVNLLGGQSGVYAFRAALESGRPQVVAPGRRAGGGSIGSDGARSPQTGGGNTYNVTLNSYGVDFSKQQDRRRIVRDIRDEIVSLERASS